MTVFTKLDVLTILKAHQETKHAAYKRLMESFVDQAVEYYAAFIMSEQSRLYHEMLNIVTSDYSHALNSVSVVIKKVRTFKAADTSLFSKELARNMEDDHLGEGGHFVNDETSTRANIYDIHKHTDFAKKLAERVGGLRFQIYLTSTCIDPGYRVSVDTYENVLYLRMFLTPETLNTTQITYQKLQKIHIRNPKRFHLRTFGQTRFKRRKVIE